ncbi:Os08g0431700 [Oryza sativa Japonica Group]|jgi:hypothetical protein|uniref:Os08g0431700 protein n=3 Tax=Oryza TaxID=4527 RepID=Q0J5I7_ORYSJ|nr:hypothetical protein EE612_044451 [Oryza sativa]BAF23778.1 Os08g0431700 [Oryza sativa Japonica Group]BAG96024.1 unnamed protein product [Oryza sativa Japonica Group]BAT05561.1 Os08g0431700 [Oryza sativa Japonica Group]|eukprot:NP_001061864.1 Os08g0431700 [Oryza sativa Japonica Group]
MIFMLIIIPIYDVLPSGWMMILPMILPQVMQLLPQAYCLCLLNHETSTTIRDSNCKRPSRKSLVGIICSIQIYLRLLEQIICSCTITLSLLSENHKNFCCWVLH